MRGTQCAPSGVPTLQWHEPVSEATLRLLSWVPHLFHPSPGLAFGNLFFQVLCPNATHRPP